MKKALQAIAGLTAVLAFGQAEVRADASAGSKFYCGSFEGAPSTMTTTKSGKQVPIITWKSSHFSGSGYTPQRRCEIVSQRFNTLHQRGQMNLLTTGRMNGLPVICAAATNPGPCVQDGLLYTLKPGQNATQTLKNLISIRTKASGPLTETASRLYISIEEIENAHENGSTSAVKLSPTSVGSDSANSSVPKSTESTDSKNNYESLW